MMYVGQDNELTEGSVDGAVASAEHPHATGEAVVAEEWEVGGQHDQIGESKVHHQHVGGSLQVLEREHSFCLNETKKMIE